MIVGHDCASELDEFDETAPGAADAEAVAAEDREPATGCDCLNSQMSSLIFTFF